MNATGAAPEPFRKHRLSVDAFHRMGEMGILAPDARVELIDGEIVDMTPIGGAHVTLVNRLARALFAATGERAIVSVQNPVVLGDGSEPQPDIALLSPTAGGDDGNVLPEADDVLLVVEVADTTLAYDRDVKLPLYARHGIPETWLVDVTGRRLTVYREPGPDGYGDGRDAETTAGIIVPSRLPGLRVDLSELFGRP